MRTPAFYYLLGTSPQKGVVCVLQTEWNTWRRSEEEGKVYSYRNGLFVFFRNKGPPCQVHWWEMIGRTWSKNRIKQYSISSIFMLGCVYLFVRIVIYCAVSFGNVSPPPPGRGGARCNSRDHAQGMKIMFSLWPRKQRKSSERHLREKQLSLHRWEQGSLDSDSVCVLDWKVKRLLVLRSCHLPLRM